MGRKKAFKPYEGKSTDNFIRLTNSMLKSPLYLSLSGGALKVYSLMKLMAVGRIEFYCSHKRLAEYIPPSTVWRGIKELVEKGFLEIKQKGCFANSTATTYKFSNKWKYM